MKKLILLASLIIGGFVYASNEVQINKLEISPLIRADSSTFSVFLSSSCSDWVTVHTHCGVTFYMCADNYDTWEDFVAAADYFTKQKCPFAPL